ncbi:MAG TPA: FMN-binding protein [Ktedonobacteraceae bacterium]
MKKFALAVLIIGSFILFSLVYNHNNNALLPPATTSSANTSNRSSSTSPTPAASSTNTPGATYKDGTYTGSVADAQWGNVQVQVVIQSGKISNVTFLEYPNERDRSVRINQSADPQLINEVIQAQSANVDIVTGATDTSEAFIQSLTDALSQAQA